MLLQHMSRERCGAVAARVATMLLQLASLWHCFSSRRGNAVAARNNDGKQRTMQRWRGALVLAATTGRAMLLCNDGRWPAPNFFCF